jgi:hypothetical protein
MEIGLELLDHIKEQEEGSWGSGFYHKLYMTEGMELLLTWMRLAVEFR